MSIALNIFYMKMFFLFLLGLLTLLHISCNKLQGEGTYRVTGQVVDKFSGEPVPNAYVELRAHAGAGTAPGSVPPPEQARPTYDPGPSRLRGRRRCKKAGGKGGGRCGHHDNAVHGSVPRSLSRPRKSRSARVWLKAR